MIFGISLKNSLRRSLLYQPLIISSYYKLESTWRTYFFLRANLVDFFMSLGYPKSFIKDKYPEEEEIVYKIVFITVIVIASFAIIGFRIFQVLSALVLFILGLLYHNPIPAIKGLISEGVPLNYENAAKYLEALDYELFLCFGLGIAMIANAFLPVDSAQEKGKEKEKEKKTAIEEVAEPPKKEDKEAENKNINTDKNKDSKKKKKKD